MSKDLSGDEGAILGLATSLDLHGKLIHDAKRLGEKWHAYVAFDFILTAWHLFNDWPKRDVGNLLSKSKRKTSALPLEMNLVINILQDLANGSKHVRLDPLSVQKRKVETIHSGNEMDW